MPTPRPRESENDFVSRCTPQVLREPKHKGMKPNQAAAICHSLFKENKSGALDTTLLEVPMLVEGKEVFVSLYESTDAYLQHMDAKEGRSATTVQTLLMDKSRFPTKNDVRAWTKERGFKSDTIREVRNTWRVRQRAPEEFSQSSFKVSQMSRGVRSILGTLSK